MNTPLNSSPTAFVNSTLLAALTLVACLLLPQTSLAAESVISMTTGSQQVLTQQRPAVRVAVGNPEVANVSVINSKSIMLTAKQPGSTTLHIWNRGVAKPRAYSLKVVAGSAPASVSNPASLSSMQVQTDIKVAELSRKTLRELGLNLSRSSNSGNAPESLTGPGGGSNPFTDAFNLIFNLPGERITGALSMLEGQGLAHVLAEPSLVALSGQTASFLAGGEIPIPVPQGGSNSDSVTIEYKQFGIRLHLTPTVLSNHRIALKVAPEVSQLDYSNAVTIGSVQVPALSVRRTETTVVLGDGESFVISGLVSQSTIANVDKIPGLGSIPILGAFFRSTRYSHEQKELVMVVTPHLVKPMKAGTPVGPLPGDEYTTYRPTTAHSLLLESGNFNPAATGWSN